ncbi:MAG TPA: ribosome small subunit-dependent GTPase A [Bacteroidales bacterium]|jgi:ribosome biogenesis GTPase|nr:ribosome small subunit-dependent GTPase A [Bacteroidales bacterium]OQB58769.1 MAG: putative ribosome biogenesis GTPase RsgA [Bacteroidetes bacterium ADurb.Bin145]HOU02970.1 ribosome small subunit-dependent GTPase A [Bacteroidales bacterium]HQG63263.1 ribosome small subunit-dependent GTPase A [Bacteroidales bacterium]HQK68258.1 ribosome small subunit-dependent GTPase A [Bacteroidales bacterium]
MRLTDLGLTKEIDGLIKDPDLSEFSVGRVTQEHRERYIVSDGENEYDSEVTGNLRFSAGSRSDFPAVGDWVAIRIYDSDKAIIYKVLPRKSVLARQAVGKSGEIQIIAANIDAAFIVQAINNNFNINRLERYLTVCYEAGVEPVLILSKIDLLSEAEINDAIRNLEKREKKIRYFLLSNLTLKGLDQIISIMQPGKTYCVIGSSGVGKSTLINNLLKKNILKTGNISSSTNKGRHITEHRELIVLENGSIIIDNPGMKELGMTDNTDGIRTTFEDIYEIASGCKFPDCKHINETGCAVLEALNNGSINKDSYDNYQKIIKEQERFHTTVAEKRKKDKVFGKMLKNYHRDMKKNE